MSINSLSQGVTMLNIQQLLIFNIILFQYGCSLVKFKISKIGLWYQIRLENNIFL